MASSTAQVRAHIRIRVYNVDKFLVEHLSTHQIDSLTDAQFRTVLVKASPVFGEKIHDIDEPWYKSMAADARVMGPDAPAPLVQIPGPSAHDTCNSHWITRAFCMLSGHTAICCIGDENDIKPTPKRKKTRAQQTAA